MLSSVCAARCAGCLAASRVALPVHGVSTTPVTTEGCINMSRQPGTSTRKATICDTKTWDEMSVGRAPSLAIAQCHAFNDAGDLGAVASLVTWS